MKLEVTNSGMCERRLRQAIAEDRCIDALIEPYIHGGYLETWFRCLQLSKQYTQNCRTGIFPSQAAFDTYCLFGCVEDFSLKEWWLARGSERFALGMTSLRVRLVVRHEKRDCYGITVDLFSETSDLLAGDEFAFWVEQIRALNDHGGLLSSAPLTWAIYKSRISYEAIKLHLDVLEAHEKIISNSPKTRLWRIGEQLRLNPKAMPKNGDTPNEKVDKHIVMGHTVSEIVRKGRGLVGNACSGHFPRFA